MSKFMAVYEASKSDMPKIQFDERDVKFFKGDNGATNNAYINYNGKILRVRVETLVLNDEGQLLLYILSKPTTAGTMYKLPGGSVEPNKSFAAQAETEVHEEARINVDNIKFTGIHYVRYYDKGKIPEWQRKKLAKQPLQYDGMLSFVYTARYVSKWSGHVAKEDYDEFYRYARWYSPKDVPLIDEHVHALKAAGFMT